MAGKALDQRQVGQRIRVGSRHGLAEHATRLQELPGVEGLPLDDEHRVLRGGLVQLTADLGVDRAGEIDASRLGAEVATNLADFQHGVG